jgi:soluble epoxide hydrolase / lipid-phosphate phosphatase
MRKVESHHRGAAFAADVPQGLIDKPLPDVPWVALYGSRDPTTDAKTIELGKEFIKKLEVVRLEGKSHWVLVDSKEEVVKAIVDMVENRLKGSESRRSNL